MWWVPTCPLSCHNSGSRGPVGTLSARSSGQVKLTDDCQDGAATYGVSHLLSASVFLPPFAGSWNTSRQLDTSRQLTDTKRARLKRGQQGHIMIHGLRLHWRRLSKPMVSKSQPFRLRNGWLFCRLHRGRSTHSRPSHLCLRRTKDHIPLSIRFPFDNGTARSAQGADFAGSAVCTSPTTRTDDQW